jgi:hypothetical protein
VIDDLAQPGDGPTVVDPFGENSRTQSNSPPEAGQ